MAAAPRHQRAVTVTASSVQEPSFREHASKGLKSNPATSHIPVIIISAVRDIKEIAEAGLADGYLKKPFDLNELLAIVQKHLK